VTSLTGTGCELRPGRYAAVLAAAALGAATLLALTPPATAAGAAAVTVTGVRAPLPANAAEDPFAQ
jgi:hypothetical protein